jgi:hypothetical protein
MSISEKRRCIFVFGVCHVLMGKHGKLMQCPAARASWFRGTGRSPYVWFDKACGWLAVTSAFFSVPPIGSLGWESPWEYATFAYMPPPLVCKIVGETKRTKCIDHGAMNQNWIPPKVGSLMPKLTVLKSMGWGYIGFSLMPWQPFSVFWLGFPRVDLVPGLTSGRRYWPKRDRNQSSKSASFSAAWYWVEGPMETWESLAVVVMGILTLVVHQCEVFGCGQFPKNARTRGCLQPL